MSKKEVAVHKGYIVLTLAFEKKDRRWIARCVELSTGTFGRTLSEAEKRIKEAVLLHLNTLEDVGECERFLKERNVTFYHVKPKSDITIAKPVSTGTFVQPYIQSVRELTAVA